MHDRLARGSAAPPPRITQHPRQGPRDRQPREQSQRAARRERLQHDRVRVDRHLAPCAQPVAGRLELLRHQAKGIGTPPQQRAGAPGRERRAPDFKAAAARATRWRHEFVEPRHERATPATDHRDTRHGDEDESRRDPRTAWQRARGPDTHGERRRHDEPGAQRQPRPAGERDRGRRCKYGERHDMQQAPRIFNTRTRECRDRRGRGNDAQQVRMPERAERAHHTAQLSVIRTDRNYAQRLEKRPHAGDARTGEPHIERAPRVCRLMRIETHRGIDPREC